MRKDRGGGRGGERRERGGEKGKEGGGGRWKREVEGGEEQRHIVLSSLGEVVCMRSIAHYSMLRCALANEGDVLYCVLA